MIESPQPIDTESCRSDWVDCLLKRRSPIVTMFSGLIAGALLITGLSGCRALSGASSGLQPSCDALVTVHESRYRGVDQTCEALKTAIEAEGLKFLKIRDTTASVIKGGVQLDRQVRVIEWCKAQYAHDMLRDNPEVSALLPCAFGVYEGDDGKIYISALNMELMGRAFGGAVAEVMGERVSRNQAWILAAHVR